MNGKIIKMSVLPLLLVLVLSGCSLKKESENEKTIKIVLVNYMTYPNKELNKAIEKYPEDIINGTIDNEAEPEYTSILKKMYQSHFTSEGYDTFILQSVMTNQAFMSEKNITTEVENSKIEETSKPLKRYKFTADIKYKNKNEQIETKKIEGNAEFKSEGKLSAFRITTNEFMDTFDN